MKDMYSKPTNRTDLSIPINKKPCIATLYKPKNVLGRETTTDVPEQLDQESSITFEKVSRETLRTIDNFSGTI